MAVRDYCWGSVIRGHHIYKTIWTPEIGEILRCEQETGKQVTLRVSFLSCCRIWRSGS